MGERNECPQVFKSLITAVVASIKDKIFLNIGKGNTGNEEDLFVRNDHGFSIISKYWNGNFSIG